MTTMTIGSGSALLDALKGCERGEWQHSPLYLWMAENFDIMERSIGGGRVRWGRIADAAYADGLMARHGGPAAPNTVKSTWYRVRKAVRRMLEMREDEAAATQARREAARAKRLQEESDAAARREAHDRALRELEDRQREEKLERSSSVLFPDSGPGPATVGAAAKCVSSDRTVDGGQSSCQPAVKIGEIAKFIVMRKQAPRYGKAALESLPEPYVGPRPDGMPEDLPLEALMPLSASGRTPGGKYDFERMPGLPRRSFFEMDREWALCCLPMIEAIPPKERSPALRAMFCLLEMKIGR